MAAVWDWPGDDREAKAKRVAVSYRDLALRIATAQTDDPQTELLNLDWFWRQREQHWLNPGPDPYDPEDWINAADAAHYTGYQPGTIRKWAEQKRKGQDGIQQRMGRDGRPLYNVGDINRYGARQRRRRIERDQRKMTLLVNDTG